MIMEEFEMEENIIDLQDNKIGAVKISDEVVSVIANIAANEIDGVTGMSSGIVSGIAEKMGMKNMSKGIKVETGEEEAAIDLYLVIKYGFKIQEVCYKVQENVKMAVENMTGLKVVEVNVHVQGVHFDKEKAKEKEKEKEVTEEE